MDSLTELEKDLASLLIRLALTVKKLDPKDPIPDLALEFLKNNNITSDILRQVLK